MAAMPVIAASAETPIPSTRSGDRGKYFLVESTRSGDIVSATHKRVGSGFTGFTKTETNCATMQMREIGYSDVSAEAIQPSPTRWFDTKPGTIKNDLAKFVCKEA
jgi:hypothetical protein